jgi:hypothetical protein
MTDERRDGDDVFKNTRNHCERPGDGWSLYERWVEVRTTDTRVWDLVRKHTTVGTRSGSAARQQSGERQNKRTEAEERKRNKRTEPSSRLTSRLT